jgi:hypothetical protein
LSKYDGCAPDEKADQGNKTKLNQKASALKLQASSNVATNSSLRGSLFDEMSAQPLTGTAEHSIPLSNWNLLSPRESLVFSESF